MEIDHFFVIEEHRMNASRSRSSCWHAMPKPADFSFGAPRVSRDWVQMF